MFIMRNYYTAGNTVCMDGIYDKKRKQTELIDKYNIA